MFPVDLSSGYFLLIAETIVDPDSFPELENIMPQVTNRRKALNGTRLDGDMKVLAGQIKEENWEVKFFHFPTRDELLAFQNSGL